jgi:hypothetical protein
VAAWYRKRLAIGPGEIIAQNPGFRPGIRLSALDDSRQPPKAGQALGEPRPVSVVVLLSKTNDRTVNVVVSRVKDEPLTHIVLIVVDNKSQ